MWSQIPHETICCDFVSAWKVKMSGFSEFYKLWFVQPLTCKNEQNIAESYSESVEGISNKQTLKAGVAETIQRVIERDLKNYFKTFENVEVEWSSRSRIQLKWHKRFHEFRELKRMTSEAVMSRRTSDDFRKKTEGKTPR